MSKIIELKHASECYECGAYLEPGEKVMWCGQGIVYGLNCHGSRLQREFDDDVPDGFNIMHADPIKNHGRSHWYENA